MARQRDPQTGQLMMEGIHAVTSDRTGAVSYRARYTYGTGKHRQFVSRTFKTHDEAEAWLLQQRLDIRRGRHIDPSTLTVAEYFERWFARMARTWSASRQTTVRTSWERYFREYFGDLRIQRVKRETLQQLVDRLSVSGLSASTVHIYMIGMVTMFDAARQDGILQANPATDLTYPRHHKTPRPVWSTLQMRRFLATTRDDEWVPLWTLLMATGCRIGEALSLHWSDIDFGRGHIWFHRTVSRGVDGVYRIRDGTKTGDRGRTVALQPWAQAQLRDHRSKAGTSPLVFHRGGQPLSPNTIRYQWHAAVKATGLPPITLHDVRHSVATALIAAGVSERVVQDILGHKSIVTTLGTYAHVDARMQQQALQAVGELLGMDDRHDNMDAKWPGP
jgi:integrase